jgi:hypothetical protein
MNNSSAKHMTNTGKALAAFGMTVVLAMAAASAQVVTGHTGDLAAEIQTIIPQK